MLSLAAVAPYRFNSQDVGSMSECAGIGRHGVQATLKRDGTDEIAAAPCGSSFGKRQVRLELETIGKSVEQLHTRLEAMDLEHIQARHFNGEVREMTMASALGENECSVPGGGRCKGAH